MRLRPCGLRDGVSVGVSTTSYAMNANEAKTRYLYALNTQRSLLDALIGKERKRLFTDLLLIRVTFDLFKPD